MLMRCTAATQVLGVLLGVNIATGDAGSAAQFPSSSRPARAPEPVVPEVEMSGAAAASAAAASAAGAWRCSHAHA
jgi:hypothetical protein